MRGGGGGCSRDWNSEGFKGSAGTLRFFPLCPHSTGSLRFALAKCYKCFDNLVSDPAGSPWVGRVWLGVGSVAGVGVGGVGRATTALHPPTEQKQHEDEYIPGCIHSPGLQMPVCGRRERERERKGPHHGALTVDTPNRVGTAVCVCVSARRAGSSDAADCLSGRGIRD